MNSELLQKHGLIVMKIAADLLEKKAGDKMETIISMTDRYKVARGTVQNAIKVLELKGAISLESRGHMGTRICDMNYEELLKCSGLNSFVGVMPLPYSKRYEGLATGIYHSLNQTNINVNMAFMSGADRRLKALLDGRYDFCVLSLQSARHYINEGNPIELAVAMKEKTYVNEHSLIVRKEFDGNYNGMRIGVDLDSYDQLGMIKDFFRDYQVELIPLQYTHILDNIRNRTIDGTIWSMEVGVASDEELKYIPLSDDLRARGNTSAAIIVRQDAVGIRNFLKNFFDIEVVEAYQRKVMDNIILPNY